MSTFDFLHAEFSEVHAEASRAALFAHPDPRVSCFYARRAVELAVKWAFKHDRALSHPYDTSLSAYLHEPSFKNLAGDKVFNLAKEVVRLGNRAAHEAQPVTKFDSVAAVSALFQFSYWFARTYSRSAKPEPGLKFDPHSLPIPRPQPQKTQAEVEQMERAAEEAAAARQRAAELLSDNAALEAELQALRAEVSAAKQLAAAIPDDHDYSETETRDFLIDLLLKEAGWALVDSRDREFEVAGMPDGKRGFVDYVLWGEDARPLALIEAKRTKRDPQVGQQQAKLYADCLEARFGRRPVIFYSNGYEHWLWDDTSYPPRRVQGFYRQDELELLMQRRTTRASLATVEINTAIVERFYQERAIRRIAESFEGENNRKALVVMATGAGKTRTVIALSDLLIRANWVKRVLFLADRTALVKQAVNAFKAHLPDSSPVNLVEEKAEDSRVYVSTYPTMMNLINEVVDGKRWFGVGYFDLVVIDEAHRSVFKKYRAIFDYFDSLLVGLTATPKEEVAKNTYELFALETGVPTDAYSLQEAVDDGFLVPPFAVSVPLKFQREGIKYDDLSEADKEAWDELDWDDEGPPPDAVGAEALNKWLFNADTVDKVLEHLMANGQKVAGGDRLGKSIIFAKNQAHADFIGQRFDANYPHLKGHFARVITHKTEYAQSLIDDLYVKDKAPHIAISVDMLDTGIDVPELLNLVFFKIVRTRSKFWQMIGRGTRLCPDLFAPGEDKQFFYVFDYCQNLEFFNQNLRSSDGSDSPSLSARLFTTRLELIGELDAAEAHPELRASISDLLRVEVESMNPDNFAVRPHRRLVEQYREADAWTELTVDDAAELARSVAGLPRQLPPEPEEAKRFDLMLLRLQLGVLRPDPAYEALRDQVRSIAGLLEDYPSIPGIAAEMELIHDLQTDEWWEDVTVPTLELTRRRLRLLVQFIEKTKRKVVYTDFEDELGDDVPLPFGNLLPASEFEKFRRKVTAFAREHKGQTAIEKVHHNWPITTDDMIELQRILIESGVGDSADFARAAEEAGSFALFIRSLVGLDRAAAKAAFAEFLDDKRYTADQLEFVNMIVDHLCQQGVVEARRFYEAPFTDISAQGPDGLFESDQVDRLVALLREVKRTAEVA